MPLTEDQRKLKEAAQAATPGPWAEDDGFISAGALPPCFEYVAWTGPYTGEEGETALAQLEANAAFIAAANPSVILALLAQVEAAPKIDPAVMEALNDARATAMWNTVTARIPECGDFGGIAQNLDWAIDELVRTGLASPVVEQATSCTAPRHECMGQCPACQAGSGAGREP